MPGLGFTDPLVLHSKKWVSVALWSYMGFLGFKYRMALHFVLGLHSLFGLASREWVSVESWSCMFSMGFNRCLGLA